MSSSIFGIILLLCFIGIAAALYLAQEINFGMPSMSVICNNKNTQIDVACNPSDCKELCTFLNGKFVVIDENIHFACLAEHLNCRTIMQNEKGNLDLNKDLNSVSYIDQNNKINEDNNNES
ncbi:MAG: hypothetical protein ACTSYD_02360 [Candidatus Heimdallarchaeaceae archaeon]